MKTNIRSVGFALLAAALVAAAMLAGCGQKGDLYLPDEEPEKSEQR